MNIILSFDFIYQMQNLKNFLPNAYEQDLTSMESVKSYCDLGSANALRKIWNSFSVNGLHFLGSGNYHYLSLFFLEKINHPFSLLVFDHHTDMQPSIFPELLSCGSWILTSLETLKTLKEVLLINVGKESLEGTKKTSFTENNFSVFSETSQILKCHYHKKDTILPITILKEEAKDKNWKKLYQDYLHYPIFLSIDKDVLSKEELETDWDQGSMSFIDLKTACKQLLDYSFPLGIDICGEGMESSDFSRSLKINREFIQLFQTVFPSSF